MQLLVVRHHLHNIEKKYSEIHKDIYYCVRARKNEKQLRKFLFETKGFIVYLRSYDKQFGKCSLSKNLMQRCHKIIIGASQDLEESEGVHQE